MIPNNPSGKKKKKKEEQKKKGERTGNKGPADGPFTPLILAPTIKEHPVSPKPLHSMIQQFAIEKNKGKREDTRKKKMIDWKEHKFPRALMLKQVYVVVVVVVAIAGGKLLMVSCIRDARERQIFISRCRKQSRATRKKSLVLKDQ